MNFFRVVMSPAFIFSNTEQTCRLLAIIILTGIQGFRSRRTDSWGKCGWDRCRWRQIVGYKTRRGRIQKRIGWICCERALGSVSTFRLSSCSCPLAGSYQQFLKKKARKNVSFNFFIFFFTKIRHLNSVSRSKTKPDLAFRAKYLSYKKECLMQFPRFWICTHSYPL